MPPSPAFTASNLAAIDFGRHRAPFAQADREAEMTRPYDEFTERLRQGNPTYQISYRKARDRDLYRPYAETDKTHKT